MNIVCAIMVICTLIVGFLAFIVISKINKKIDCLINSLNSRIDCLKRELKNEQ